MAKTFQARYQGQCAACDEDIDVGEWITYDLEDQVIHEDCAEDGDDELPEGYGAVFG